MVKALRKLGGADVIVLRLGLLLGMTLGMVLTRGSLSCSAVVFWGQYWWCQVLWAALWPRHGSGPEAEWGCGLCPGEDEHPGDHQQHAAVMAVRLCRLGPSRVVLPVLTVYTDLPPQEKTPFLSKLYLPSVFTDRLLFYWRQKMTLF